VVQKVRDILSRAEGFLFPKELVATRAVQKKRKLKLPKGNGGWGDARDHELCTKLSEQDVTQFDAVTQVDAEEQLVPADAKTENVA
jgi:hypothetical protein